MSHEKNVIKNYDQTILDIKEKINTPFFTEEHTIQENIVNTSITNVTALSNLKLLRFLTIVQIVLLIAFLFIFGQLSYYEEVARKLYSDQIERDYYSGIASVLSFFFIGSI